MAAHRLLRSCLLCDLQGHTCPHCSDQREAEVLRCKGFGVPASCTPVCIVAVALQEATAATHMSSTAVGNSVHSIKVGTWRVMDVQLYNGCGCKASRQTAMLAVITGWPVSCTVLTSQSV
jgi:hypothetical protein